MKNSIILLIFMLVCMATVAQTDSLKIQPIKTYKAHRAFEVESLVPMFVTGGYHFAVCYRYEKFRFRMSVINGGTYDAEPAGVNNSAPEFKRYYKTSPGFFVGYNVWRNLETYGYLELHTFEIEQKSSSERQKIHSTDVGGGISYQFFIGKRFYVQPGFHIYLRKDNSLNLNGTSYSIPNVDLAPVLRLGYRIWAEY